MIINILTVAALLILIITFGWLTLKAWRSKKAWLKWPGSILSGLLTLVLAAFTAVILSGFYRLNIAPSQYALPNVQASMTPAQIARGERIAYICADCHSSTGKLPLDGSKDNFAAGGPPIGVIYATNLTPAGPLKNWSDAEIMRAMREGIDKNGRPLVIMPSQAMHELSDEDSLALVAYLRSQPAVDRPLPERDLNAIAAIFIGAGLFPTSAQSPITEPIIAPTPGTADYGHYLVSAMGCRDCHGRDLTGQSGGFGPSAPNIAAMVPAWQEADFMDLIREGRDRTGRTISSDMPWKSYNAALTDAELKDMFTYLHGLKPDETAAESKQ